jgi:hypothetical protein
LCCSAARFGRSRVMNEYNSFCILSSGLVIFGFSEWNSCNLCGSVDSGFGLSIKLLIRFDVHWVEFSIINWLLCVGMGASVLILHKIGSFLDSDCCLCRIVLVVDLYWWFVYG